MPGVTALAAIAASRPHKAVIAMSKPSLAISNDAGYRAEQSVRKACVEANARRRPIAIITLTGAGTERWGGTGEPGSKVKVLCGRWQEDGDWTVYAMRSMPRR